jgi:transposase
MPLYGGIDLHSNNSVIALTDETDRIVYRKRLANDEERILEALDPYQEAIHGLVVESTYNWYWLVDALMAAGYQVHLERRGHERRGHTSAGVKSCILLRAPVERCD